MRFARSARAVATRAAVTGCNPLRRQMYVARTLHGRSPCRLTHSFAAPCKPPELTYRVRRVAPYAVGQLRRLRTRDDDTNQNPGKPVLSSDQAKALMPSDHDDQRDRARAETGRTKSSAPTRCRWGDVAQSSFHAVTEMLGASCMLHGNHFQIKNVCKGEYKRTVNSAG